MFYGWYVVSGAFIAQVFIAGFMTYSFGLFVLPLQAEFAASRADVMVSMTILTVTSLLGSPAIGWCVDRYSTRWLMAIGALIFGIGLYSMSLTQSVLHFSIVFGISVSLSSILLGPLTGSATVSRWFNKKRGQALGLAAVGTSLGGILLPLFLAPWINDYGWREALQILSAIVLVGLLPALILLIRSSPQEVGLHADGIKIAPHVGTSSDMTPMSMGQILSHRSYWSIGICMGLVFAVYSALMANLIPHAIASGIEQSAAAKLIMIIAGAGMVGKIVFGMAADYVSPRLALLVTILLIMVGLAILINHANYTMMMLAAIALGLAAGGMLPVWSILLAAIFGVSSFGKAMGLMSPLITLLIMPSFWFTGVLYDQTGSYNAAFIIFCGMLVIASFSLVWLKVPTK